VSEGANNEPGLDGDALLRRLAELTAHADLFQEILANLPVILFRLDRHGMFTLSVGAGLARLGLRDGQAVGTSAFTALPEARAELEAALAGGTLVFETTRRSTDSTEHSVRFRYLIYAAFDSARGEGVVAFAIDLTQGLKAEDNLQRSEAGFRSLVDHSPDIVLRIDRSGTITFVNRAVNDSPLGVIKGRNVLDFALERELPKLRASVRRAFEDGHASQLECEARGLDGVVRPYDVRISPIPHPTGPEAAIVVATDMTERKRLADQEARLQAQIQQSQKLESLGLLAGGVAHDFNNLLMGVLGNASLVLMDMSPDATHYQHLKGIETSARRAAELCQQMLAYSGKGRFVVRPIDVSEVVLGTVRLLEASIPKHVTLKYDCLPGERAVEADIVQLRQIVMNLVLNAADAIGDRRGMVTIRTGAMYCDSEYLGSTFFDDRLSPGHFAFIEISDTGCGMDKVTRTQMFDPFYSTKSHGRGLGLAAVLGIVRGHKGAIKVYSELNVGTTIKVILPVSELPAQRLETDTGSVRPPAMSGRVLIIDDEPMILNIAAEILEQSGFSVLTAADGEEGLAKFRENLDISLVLLDLTMPRMSGDEVFRELRKIKPTVRVLLSSGYNEQDTTSRFAGKGLAGFIQKPYGAEQLVEAVRHVLQSESSI
jgi:two-component system cell cycle sensor histidine kinase/response regulator CckA